jgi:hypothetical protein
VCRALGGLKRASFKSGRHLLGGAIRVYGFKIDVGRGMKGEVGGVIGGSG